MTKREGESKKLSAINTGQLLTYQHFSRVDKQRCAVNSLRENEDNGAKADPEDLLGPTMKIKFSLFLLCFSYY